jgi:hypothetical protein
MTFFFLDQLDLWKFSVWAAAIALYFFIFWDFLKKNLTKIWGASPPLGTYNLKSTKSFAFLKKEN